MTNFEKVNFWMERRRKGDVTRVANNTWYSPSHISNMVSGRRAINSFVADTLYRLSRRRLKNETLANRHGLSVSQVMREYA